MQRDRRLIFVPSLMVVCIAIATLILVIRDAEVFAYYVMTVVFLYAMTLFLLIEGYALWQDERKVLREQQQKRTAERRVHQLHQDQYRFLQGFRRLFGGGNHGD